MECCRSCVTDLPPETIEALRRQRDPVAIAMAGAVR
jgi:hypothetical protein